ncbi:MAG TPA: cobalamin biosynthesis protein CobD [Candidatus Copromorpha excrementigallinarum]|uniref:Cobalamin biosynthesis protein CobD n=1 Tax=Candidatus Allocopromorpha excrementigallinarum TaxID=2840742 RepID=A0A9D1L709_9FIRM|nr:cobalamin biosynthesis protein CobD [Candidatus Copromorpha excrementigallinarum]
MVPLLTGVLADFIFGDPRGMPHPVRLMGIIIEKGEGPLRRIFPSSPGGERAAGALLSIGVVLIFLILPALILWALALVNPWLSLAAEAFMCWQAVSVKGLKKESMKVEKALEEGDVEKARGAVSMIVGRDTERLDEKGIIKAAVETVAENTSDGAIAPMMFIMVGGAPLGFFYKAVNTLDSMIGYKNDRYINFGAFAARLDDVCNFIPARVSAMLMVCAAFLTGLDGRNAWKIFRRDRFNHASPNSAQTEAVCAGALRIRLAGDAWYFGKLYRKKYIGDDLRPVEAADIRRANMLLYATSLICLGLGAALWIMVILWI